MIVLALLAFLVALTWPALRQPLLRSVTQQAAQQLVDDLANARLIAVESGQTLALRYEPDGSRYNILPAEPSGEDGQSDPSDAPSGVTRPEEIYDPLDGLDSDMTLDSDVVFRDPSMLDDAELFGDSVVGDMLRDEMQETKEVEPLIADDRESRENWSRPVMFYPTGRAENATFLLQGPDGYSVAVTLRGLTGAVTIGELTKPEEADSTDIEQGIRNVEQDRVADF
jgi:hypothetical protein